MSFLFFTARVIPFLLHKNILRLVVLPRLSIAFMDCRVRRTIVSSPQATAQLALIFFKKGAPSLNHIL